MLNNKIKYWLMDATVCLILLCACGNGSNGPDEEADASAKSDAAINENSSFSCPDDAADQKQRPDGWTVESHCSKVPPAYDMLFRDDVVHRFDFIIEPDDYARSLEDLSDKLSGGGPPGSEDNQEDPIFIPVTMKFGDLEWTKVGMRYKGNSSLRSAYQSGIRKLAIRLNFELFEDVYPETMNQRFYGFEKMTFSNAFKDSSLIRDKVAADIFRNAGVPVARGAFARIYVDYGEGPVYFGLYTMIEDPSDKMLDEQFGNEDGNLYKPEGDAAKLGFFDEKDFDNKTNWENPDYTDVINFIDALNSDRSNAEFWKSNLEAVFNVEGFLRVLAVNQAMVNWDSYGFMSHNYYIYQNLDDNGRLHWFPWDLNEAMINKSPGGIDASSVLLEEITAEWPLIRYLLDDSEYLSKYKSELEAVLDGGFAIDTVHNMMDRYHELIESYVIGPDGERQPYTFLKSDSEFADSLTDGKDSLKNHVEDRQKAVKAALEQ